MRLGLILGIVLAVLAHVVILLFGGILFPRHEESAAVRDVELVGEMDAERPAEEKPPEETAAEEPIEEAEEQAPDAEQAIRAMEEPTPTDLTPRLEDASLGAIAAALSGQGSAAGDFAETLTFASGGRIGGTGRAGAGDTGEDPTDGAFSMAEIDQKPRATYQAAANYPKELAGKRIEGVVSVIFVVDDGGKVRDLRVEKSTHPAFEKPALDAVRQWRFEAGVKGGKRVACRMRVPIRFQPS